MSRVHGIAPHEITFIFREFHELHNPERDRRKRLGLGLSIVQRLTKTLQYELSVHSIVGKGSKFSIALPLSTVPAQAAERGVRAEPHTVQPLHWRVMVVDDDEFVRTGIEVIAALRTTRTSPPFWWREKQHPTTWQKPRTAALPCSTNPCAPITCTTSSCA